MTSRLGVEIGARSVRAVKVEGTFRRRWRSLELPWDGERLAEALARVQAELGPARHVSIALDLPLLLVKEVALPALPPAGKIAVLMLEPERYFPIRGEELVVTARAHDALVVAAREQTVSSALEAAAGLGAIDRVEGAPHALVRALAALGVRRGTVVLRPPPRGSCIVRLDGGALSGVRWIYDETAAADALATAGGPPLYAVAGAGIADATPLPAPQGLGEQFLVAFGAALGVGAPLGETLVTPDVARRIAARRRWRVAAAAGTLAAALLFALGAFDRAATRVAGRLAARADSLAVAAERALALQLAAEGLERQQRGALALRSGRPQALGALAALGRRLPPDAYLRTLRAAGDEWQLDGYAREAARLVPLLEAAPEFEQVRFLTATTTERVGNETRETFSIAFRLAGRP